jgi:hypothetical protein
MKKCPQCEGAGWVHTKLAMEQCDKCNETGKVPVVFKKRKKK